MCILNVFKMKKTVVLLVLILSYQMIAMAQNIGTGKFTNAVDVGDVKLPGKYTYDAGEQAYILKGAGTNMWFDHDAFYLLYRKMEGDFMLTADLVFGNKGKNPHRKAGWIVRKSTDANAAHVSAVVHAEGLTSLQFRSVSGAQTEEVQSPRKSFQTIRLEKQSDRFIMSAAHRGEPLQVIGDLELSGFTGELYVGLFVCSHEDDEQESVTFSNVRISKPVAAGYDPWKQGFLGCRLETMDVFNGARKVIYTSDGRFEAPNWMPDGKRLLFNMKGLLYKIPVEGGSLEQLNTDFADALNNDHGISFDGKMLAISHSREGLPGGGSTVYVLPLEGGKPRLVTEKTPSYWHGWSADNREVAYVAKRGGGMFDIYKKAIDGGPEIRLTENIETHADGPEYTPDGSYIYYNTNPTGTMQIWRMKPDGTGKEQITFDDYNDWFPHISPDGKWIVFISFAPDIEIHAHPSYKRVMLRIMPLSGGAPKVIAYLYGGQGTINVPSWSPDSKRIAFVSNSE